MDKLCWTDGNAGLAGAARVLLANIADCQGRATTKKGQTIIIKLLADVNTQATQNAASLLVGMRH